MALIRKWDGIGVSNGTLGTKAGTGDTAFDSTNASPSVGGEWISKAGNTQHYWDWNTSALGAVSVRFYLVQRSAPGGTGVIFQAWNTTTSGRVFGLSINTSNQLALRNSSNSAIYTTGPLEMGRPYLIDIYKAAGNSTVTLRVQDMMTGGEHSNGGGSPGSSNTVSHFQFGQTSGTNSGGWRYSHFRIEDTGAQIGPYVAEAGDFDVEHTRYGSTTSASSHSVPLPSTEWGDLLVANLRSGSNTAPTIPGGWTAVGGGDGDLGSGALVISREATGGEGATLSVAVSGGAHLAAVVYRVRSSRTLGATLASYDTTASDDVSAPRSGERNLWLALTSWKNSNASIVTAASSIDVLVQESSGSASGRPAVAIGERRWTGNSLTPGSPSDVSGTLASPRAGTIVVQFDTPTEPPAGESLEWFTWDGSTLTPVDALGAWEAA